MSQAVPATVSVRGTKNCAYRSARRTSGALEAWASRTMRMSRHRCCPPRWWWRACGMGPQRSPFRSAPGPPPAAPPSETPRSARPHRGWPAPRSQSHRRAGRRRPPRQCVAHEHPLNRYGVHGPVLQSMGHAGCLLEQGRQFPLCAIRCLVFKCPTCGDHETDHRPGQILTEYQRPDDGEEGDDIHAGRAPAQTANQGGSDRNEGEPGRPVQSTAARTW